MPPDAHDTAPEWQELMNLCLIAVRMRRRQISYFSGGRNSHALMAAKETEQEFDRTARKLLGNAGETRQPAAINPPR
jgi:hypothetical protein